MKGIFSRHFVTFRRAARWGTAILMLCTLGCDDDNSKSSAEGGEQGAAGPSETPESSQTEESGQENGESGEDSAPIEIQGSWNTNFGGVEIINSEMWSQAYTPDEAPVVSLVVDYDNSANWAIVLSPEDASFSPNTYSKQVWTEPETDSFWLCTVAFGLGSEQEAIEISEIPDASDPETGGCSGFPWSRLSRQDLQ